MDPNDYEVVKEEEEGMMDPNDYEVVKEEEEGMMDPNDYESEVEEDGEGSDVSEDEGDGDGDGGDVGDTSAEDVDGDDSKDNEEEEDDEEAKLECEICGMRFKKASHVQTHIDYKHTQVADRKFICGICPYRFVTQRDQDRHRKVCKGQAGFE